MSETRKVAAILVADVVGYSRLAGADEDRSLSRLRGLRSDLIDPTISVHHGRIVKRTGDGSVIEFRSVVDAVRCAVEVQHAIQPWWTLRIRSFPRHAASKPVGLIPQCAADRHITFSLDGSGPAQLTPPDLSLWPDLSMGDQAKAARRVNLDALTRADVATWRAGEALLLSGRMLTGRDAAHQRLVSMIEAGEPLPVDLRDRAIYYVGPVGAAISGWRRFMNWWWKTCRSQSQWT